MVQNMFWSLPSERAVFRAFAICEGLSSWSDTLRNRERSTAMNNDAGTPLPDTAPIQKKNLPSRIK